jgi:hypothetical protein
MDEIGEGVDSSSAVDHYDWIVAELEKIETSFATLQDDACDVEEFEQTIVDVSTNILAYVKDRYPHRLWPFDNWADSAQDRVRVR